MCYLMILIALWESLYKLSQENKIKNIPEDQLFWQLINLYLGCSGYSGDSKHRWVENLTESVEN